eukprot:2540483-Heterocapsa_arctica.AAC.1
MTEPMTVSSSITTSAGAVVPDLLPEMCVVQPLSSRRPVRVLLATPYPGVRAVPRIAAPPLPVARL